MQTPAPKHLIRQICDFLHKRMASPGRIGDTSRFMVSMLFLFGALSILAAIGIVPRRAVSYLASGSFLTPAPTILELQIYRWLLFVLGGMLVAGSVLLLKTPNHQALRSQMKSLALDERLMVGLVFLLGGALRLIHLLFVGVDTPFRAGALFLEFSRQIAANRFLLPANIPFFTDGGIPFAYPPLPFYVEAVLLSVFSLPDYSVVNLLPPFIAVLTLPSFYVLTRVAGLTFPTRLAALIAFAVLPNAFRQQIHGGGLSEAFGTLALIWFVVALLRCQKVNTFSNYMLVGVLWAVCVVSSPGSAYASLLTFLIFSIAQFAESNGRDKLKSIGLSCLAGAVALIVSSPYWLTVVSYHGLQVFVDAFGGQHSGIIGKILNALESLLKFEIAEGGSPFIWNMVIFAGLAWGLFHRHWALVVWFLVLVGIPREGDWLRSIPAAILAGIGSVKIFVPALNSLTRRFDGGGQRIAITTVFLTFVGISAFSGTFRVVRFNTLSEDNILSPGAIQAMMWIDDNLSASSRLIVLANHQVQEWTPQISRRTVLNMPAGAEWQPQEMRAIWELEDKLDACSDYDCVLSGVKATMGYDEVFLLMDKELSSDLASAPTGGQAVFSVAWENDEFVVGSLSSLLP